MECYLDNSATTPVCREAADAVYDALLNNWGNPSSLYKKGIEAENIVESAREAVAEKLSCRSEEVFFTSGGTESNNIAVLGTAASYGKKGRIIISSVEHSSIEEPAKKLEKAGYDIVRLGVDRYGMIDENELYNAVTPDTILISVMAVNNEVGTIEPIRSLRRAAAKTRALVHVDAVQAFGKTDIRPSAIGADLMSISSHKIHGPKGAGALYIRGGFKKDRAGVRISPRTFGGLQEKTLRPGTEPVPAIAGFGAAVRALPDTAAELKKITLLRDYLIDSLRAVDGVVINSPPDALPFVTNISVLGIKSEPMMNYLSSVGIYVSSGSACSKGQKSRVLRAMGISDENISSALRISFSRFTTSDEIDMLINGIIEGRKKIRSSRR
ncbi:MAG: cysteine desulfurase [Clostridiales bacterium]|nr:cysteine desulfurase [Clostridiales bacterium]